MSAIPGASGQQASFAGRRIQPREFLLQQGNLQQLDGPQQQAVGSPSRDDRGQLPAGPNDGDGQAFDVAVVVLPRPQRIEKIGGPGRTRTCNQAVMSETRSPEDQAKSDDSDVT